jgi:replicative DNA helicase
MTEKPVLQSEGAELGALLEELQKERSVKEISGWETGFANLSRALDGILPGLYLLIGPPACGKTSLAKQLLDQVAMHNSVAGIFFTFAERRKELGIKTLARLSEIDSREIRRGSAYLLHWYGVPKAHHSETESLAPSWDKIIKAAQQAKPWLDRVYIIEGRQGTGLAQIKTHIGEVQSGGNHAHRVIAIIDDCQRLGAIDQPLHARLPIVAEQLQETAVLLNIPILGVWPDLGEDRAVRSQLWCERVPSADVILVLQPEPGKSQHATEPNQPMTLEIVRNRGGEKGTLLFDFFPPFAKFVER